jgi:hypothetical protein
MVHKELEIPSIQKGITAVSGSCRLDMHNHIRGEANTPCISLWLTDFVMCVEE